VVFSILIEAGKKEEVAVAAVNPQRLPCILRSGPFVKSVSGNHTTPMGEGLGESWPAFHGFSFGPDAARQGLTRWAAEKIAGWKPPMIQRPWLPAKRISGPDLLEQDGPRRFIHDASGSTAWADRERARRLLSDAPCKSTAYYYLSLP
jgi:hypothetical protein